MTNDVITLDRITKRYADFTLDLTMHVPKDTITALVGVNGSGKTTTFRIILGLAKPDTGSGTLLEPTSPGCRTPSSAMSAPSSRIRPSTPCSLGTTSYGR